MTAWDELETELDQWLALGQRAQFWWRDDDAARETMALRRLLDVSSRRGVALALAVPPALATDSIGDLVSGARRCTALQHGFAHKNHAGAQQKKCELGDDRPLQSVLDELRQGHERLQGLMAEAFLPVVVPPWNRIGDRVLAELAGLGFTGISTYTGRRHAQRHGLVQCNTHVDIIDWKGSRGFVGLEVALGMTLSHLRAKRTGDADPTEPTGLLSHHLQHDEDCWQFVDEFIGTTRKHPAVTWRSATEIFR